MRIPSIHHGPSFLLLIHLLILPGSAASADEKQRFSKEELAFFEEQVRPILAKNCQGCHGKKGKPKAGLSLLTRQGLKRGGDSGPAINSKEPDKSILLDAINYQTFEMPPSGKLPAKQITVLTKWIRMGAPWTPGGKEVHTEKQFQITDADRKWWAYQPVKRPTIPSVRDRQWVRNGIDAFVLSKLEKAGVPHSQDADKRVLARRLYYDVTGLPPTEDQIQSFLKDSSPMAYERLVEKLLSSSAFGEKWGRHWLDLVRYAETNGYERDSPKPFAWRYRDYVIRSLNADKPYDRFLLEQLAGDEMPDPGIEQLTATGYYRLAVWDDEPADGKLAKYDYLDSILSTTSQVTMGMTIGCARCHSHKADPIPHQDYYRMLALFENVAWNMRDQATRTIRSPEDVQRVAQRVESHRKNVQERRKLIASFETALSAAMKKAGLEAPERNSGLTALLLDSQKNGQKWSYTTKKPPDDWASPGFDVRKASWEEGQGGFGTRGTPGSVVRTEWRTSDIWLRKKFPLNTLPKSLILRYHHDEDVEVYLNGVKIFEKPGYIGKYEETQLPESALDALQTGQNVLAVHVKQTGGGQYIDTGLYTKSGRLSFAAAAAKHGKKLLGEEAVRGYQRAQTELVRLMKSVPDPKKVGGTTILSVAERGDAPTFVWLRGNPHLQGPRVSPGAPVVLSVKMELPNQRTKINTTGRRTALAKWLVQRDHPLTSRVAVNRIWQHYMGRGICPTPNDFGKLGQLPSHPKLLDWLAAELMHRDWSQKELHRLILLSSTYRQASSDNAAALAKDPANNLHWRHNMRRLTAEEIRDSILQLNGSLNREMSGPSIYTKIPDAIRQTASRPNAAWGRSSEANASRRSVYIYVKRSLVEPFLAMFDVADTDNSCAVRFATTVPTQSLSMLNSEFTNEQAMILARRLKKEAGEELADQVRLALRLAVSRPVSDEEVSTNVKLIESLQQEDGVSPEIALNYFCLLVLNLNEFVYLD